ncbi:MAG: ABC transporter permease [Pseudomonadota bacterium]
MTATAPKRSLILGAFAFIELLFYCVVREVRNESGGHPILGILAAVARILMMVFVFYLAFAIAGFRSAVIRGDIVLYLLSGFLLFFLHNAGVSKVLGGNSFTGNLQQHAPMKPILAIAAATLGALYLHILAFLIILGVLFLAQGQVGIHDPAGLLLPFFLAWASGVVIGLVLMSLKPFVPKLVQMVSTFYQRANMVTSGKFFVANQLPASWLPFFAWNPLFHCIDQMRGAMFVNYFPNTTTIMYPLYLVAGGIVLGMMIEFWLRNTVGRSTGKARG